MDEAQSGGLMPSRQSIDKIKNGLRLEEVTSRLWSTDKLARQVPTIPTFVSNQTRPAEGSRDGHYIFQLAIASWTRWHFPRSPFICHAQPLEVAPY